MSRFHPFLTLNGVNGVLKLVVNFRGNRKRIPSAVGAVRRPPILAHCGSPANHGSLSSVDSVDARLSSRVFTASEGPQSS
jgi:hypothetical protein